MYSLYLCDSTYPNNHYTQSELIDFLISCKLIHFKSEQLLPADLFMQHITFLGCSPNLGEGISTQITAQKTSNIRAIGGNSISKLSCPHCKEKLDEPSLLISNYSINKNWYAPCCLQKIPLSSINWRKSAGFSNTFIQISNIFPKEAIPSDDFLLLLSQFSLSSWHYFYSKQQLF